MKTPINQSIIKYIIFIFTQDDQSIELAGSRYEIDADNGILIIKKVIKDDHGNYRCKAFSEGKFDEKTAELRVLGMCYILVSFLDDFTIPFVYNSKEWYDSDIHYLLKTAFHTFNFVSDFYDI